MSLLLPLNNPRVGFHSGALYAKLQKSQWDDIPSLERLQEKKIQYLIERAKTTVPFYKDYKDWDNDGKGSLRDKLATYPILTKDDIRASPSRMHSIKTPRSFIKTTTGGTTGSPIEIWRERGVITMMEVSFWRGKSWVGIRPSTRGVNIQSFGRGSWYGRIRMRLTNKWLMDVFAQTKSDKAKNTRTLLKLKPNYIEGFVSDTLVLGEACLNAGVKIDRVLTTGEMLYDHNRSEIERLFSAKVAEYYGSNEVGSIAFECEMGQKHITDEHVILEVVDEEGVTQWGKPGRILLTDLDNYLTPLIRYEVGDIGVINRSTCLCGRKLTVLSEIQGRTQDFIRNESGQKLSALFFAGRFKNLNFINSIQIIQRSYSKIDILYEAKSEKVNDELNEISSEILARLGPQMIISFQQVERLIYSGRGKRRFIINLQE